MSPGFVSFLKQLFVIAAWYKVHGLTIPTNLFNLRSSKGALSYNLDDGSIHKGMVQTSLCSIGYRMIYRDNGNSDKDKAPIICIHSSPRSSDEFQEIMPLLPSDRTVIALDTPGYGHSENPTRSCTWEDIGDVSLEAVSNILHSLGSSPPDKLILFGSLMGNFVALNISSKYPDLVEKVICVNLYCYPRKSKNAENGSATVSTTIRPDPWQLKDDGSMLADLYTKRPWLSGDPELTLRVANAELSYLTNRRARYNQGIIIQDNSDVDIEPMARKTSCPVLAMKGWESARLFDQIGYQLTEQFNLACSWLDDVTIETLGIAVGIEIEGHAGDDASTVEGDVRSNINLVNQMPEQVAGLVNEFIG